MEELVNQFVNRKDQRDALKEKIAQELKEIGDPSFVEEFARKYPEWAREYVELALGDVKHIGELPDNLSIYKIPLSVAAKFKPELVKEWLDHEIKEKGLDPRELLEQEKGRKA